MAANVPCQPGQGTFTSKSPQFDECWSEAGIDHLIQ